MRIRTIKPEFWRSDDIAMLPIFDRLLFIGLWSYVDDNGVGRYHLIDICADLFAPDLARDSQETLKRVSEGLRRLSDHHMIDVYEASGRKFVSVTNWGKHQKVNHPNTPRYPRPSNDSQPLLFDSPETLLKPQETLLPGTGEQGNRGTVIKPPVAPPKGGAPSKEVAKRSQRRSSKTLIPDSWKPNDHHAKTAATRHIDIDTEANKFRAYAESNAKRYANWDQAFNNWLLNCSNFNRSTGYVNRAQQRYDQNVARIKAAEAQQPQLTGGPSNDFGY
ncbi:MAG: hypothetical protein SOI13_01370 [Bifidobacterium mongoliense]|jgi:hypothetical protein|uniref:hypothetical protein n=1 Tax=Bifidobacterium mongoliense TaxID=518643 RepID=UPI002F353F21